MSTTEYSRRLCRLELLHDQAVPPHALELARHGDLARMRAHRAANRSRFFDRFARDAQRAIQCRRAASALPIRDSALDGLAIDLRAARRRGLRWLARENS